MLSGRGAPAVRGAVAAIVAEEGFTLNERKSQLMTRAGRQRVTGIVVNERTNVARDEYDRLKAALHRIARDGPGDMSAAELSGRIGWVEQLNPARGAKLRERFDRVSWDGRRG